VVKVNGREGSEVWLGEVCMRGSEVLTSVVKWSVVGEV
jgi:hypothetical protein